MGANWRHTNLKRTWTTIICLHTIITFCHLSKFHFHIIDLFLIAPIYRTEQNINFIHSRSIQTYEDIYNTLQWHVPSHVQGLEMITLIIYSDMMGKLLQRPRNTRTLEINNYQYNISLVKASSKLIMCIRKRLSFTCAAEISTALDQQQTISITHSLYEPISVLGITTWFHFPRSSIFESIGFVDLWKSQGVKEK